MKSLNLVLAAVFGFTFGAALFHAPAMKAQGTGVAVSIYGDKLTAFTEGLHTWTGGYIQTKGAQVVGFSCVKDNDDKLECFVAVTR
jgi:hypothetical protein